MLDEWDDVGRISATTSAATATAAVAATTIANHGRGRDTGCSRFGGGQFPAGGGAVGLSPKPEGRSPAIQSSSGLQNPICDSNANCPSALSPSNSGAGNRTPGNSPRPDSSSSGVTDESSTRWSWRG